MCYASILTIDCSGSTMVLKSIIIIICRCIASELEAAVSILMNHRRLRTAGKAPRSRSLLSLSRADIFELKQHSNHRFAIQPSSFRLSGASSLYTQHGFLLVVPCLGICCSNIPFSYMAYKIRFSCRVSGFGSSNWRRTSNTFKGFRPISRKMHTICAWTSTSA